MGQFGRVHAFGYNSAKSKPIWMTSGALRVHWTWGVALTDFGRDPRSSKQHHVIASESIFLTPKFFGGRLPFPLKFALKVAHPRFEHHDFDQYLLIAP